MAGNENQQPIRIPLEEAKEKFDEDDVAVLDVVDPGSYEDLPVRIEGAVRIDPRRIDEEYGRLTEAQEVLAYCT